MKRLLLPLLAALVLPTAVNAESYAAGVAKIQWPKMKKLVDNAIGFLNIGDTNAACSKFEEYDLLLEMNFEGLQELYPNTDWFDIKKKNNEIIKDFC
tara:strand:- start:138 stop:428 length:291 start_codon:yes stop_codon:yes gene_type:complete